MISRGVFFGAIGNGLHRKRWDHRDNVGELDDACNWRRVLDEIEFELFVERRVDGVRAAPQQQRVAVGRCTNNRLGRYIGAAAGPVLDDERLPEPV